MNFLDDFSNVFNVKKLRVKKCLNFGEKGEILDLGVVQIEI